LEFGSAPELGAGCGLQIRDTAQRGGAATETDRGHSARSRAGPGGRGFVTSTYDNDFGIAGVVDAPTQLWVLLLADPLPLRN